MGTKEILSGLLLALALASATCAAAVTQSAATIKVLILPPEIKIYQLTAANTLDEQPQASAKASAEALKDALAYMHSNATFTPITMPQLSADEQETLNQHLALYRVAASTAMGVSLMGGPWARPFTAFDYTAGPGLKFLQTRTGATVALILIGKDAESSGGHIALGIFMSLLGVVTPQGRNFMNAGLIDLDSGQIRWLEYDDQHAMRDFTNPAVITEIVNEMLQKYPKGSIHSDTSP